MLEFLKFLDSDAVFIVAFICVVAFAVRDLLRKH